MTQKTATPRPAARGAATHAELPPADFDWQDPLAIEGELTEDERMVQATARGHAQDRLFPRVLTAFREERFDREIMTEMGALGLLGPTLPPRPRVRWRPRYDRASEFAKGDPDLAVPSRKR